VDDISFDIEAGKTLALVGESGCGKTTAGQALIGLTPIKDGEIEFDGKCRPKRARDWKVLRREIAFIFQDPYASLDPLWRIRSIISEPMVVHRIASGAKLNRRVEEVIKTVGLDPALLDRRPFELSGGQRQRVAVARALASGPKLIIADEPTAALDVSIRAQILNLLKELQGRLGLSMLFISHDLATVRFIADDVAVMYAGAIVEIGPTSAVLSSPSHPYAAALIASEPSLRNFRTLPPVLEGEVPDPRALPSGCRFRTRCSKAQELCAREEPKLRNVGLNMVACHFPGN